MVYPKFIKENNEAPITYRVLLSPASGIELHGVSGLFHLREVYNQAEISSWDADTLFVEADKKEIVEAFERIEDYVGDKRVMIEKLLNAKEGNHDTTGGINY